jgi:2-phosphosulfolactate phosphatase
VRVDVAFTPAELPKGGAAGRTVVVLDVLRATSSIVQALVNGARRIIPVATVEEAVRRAEELGRDAVLLCGERDCQRIRGFDLGNSPEEFTPEKVAGSTLIMTTTNGTPALLAAAGSAQTLVGSLLNARAVAERIAGAGRDALILCAGREGRFASEDAIGAALILRRLRVLQRRFRTDDAGRAALRLLGRRETTAAGVLWRCAAGRRLREVGLGEDVHFCARVDLHAAVPVFLEQRIELTSAE